MSTMPLVDGTVPDARPTYALFDSNAVGLATFFGSPVAGGALMAWNYQRLGQMGKAVLTLGLTALVTLLVVVVGWNAKPGTMGVLGVVLFIAMQRIAALVQGKAVSRHVEEGGALGSKWIAFALGIGFLLLVFGVVFAHVMGTMNRNRVQIGKDDVYYVDGATKEEAQAVGNELKASGFFTGRGVSVTVGKDKDGPVFSVGVQDGLWNQPESVSQFEEVGREMAPLMGGYPIKVRLMDTSETVKKEEVVGRAEFPGQDDVFYQGGVTQAQAQGVGEALKTAGYFEGRGVDVFLDKQGGTASIAFVANSKAWTDQEMLKGFETMTRAVAPSLGGLPVRLQLEDNTQVVKKEEVLR